ncbi:MAG: aminotransferase class I/II-fold pyridoxal phosphate-dependent enzyme [Candidatus Bathyarchaeia archaeon]
MKIKQFDLERWLPTHSCKYDLAGSVVKPLKLNELIKELSLDLELMHGPTQGPKELRCRVSELYSNIDEDNVLIVNGTTEGNFLAMSYLIEPGDEVLIGGLPTYLQSVGLAEALGARVKFFNLIEQKNYQLDMDSLNNQVSKRTKMIIIVNPNNPTGSYFSRKEVESICEVAGEVNAYVLADEVLRYTELNGSASLSPVEVYSKGISTGSLSKLGLAGLRTGWLVADKKLVQKFWAQKDYTTLANPILSDHVASIALQKENFKKIRQRAIEICQENLKIFLKWLEKNKQILKCISPAAGAVVFPQYKLKIDSVRLCKKLLTEKSILLTPGDYFKAPKHFRLQYGGVEKDILKTALEHLGNFLRVIDESG